MALIDSNNFITHLVWSGLIDKATCGELKKAIELCTVKDIYTKADMVAMLDKIRNEFIDRYPRNYANELELGGSSCVFSLNDILRIIDKYKTESEKMSKHWIDDADHWICPDCGFITPNPNRYAGCKCPKCGFQDEKDKAETEAEDGNVD